LGGYSRDDVAIVENATRAAREMASFAAGRVGQPCCEASEVIRAAGIPLLLDACPECS
jgi:hypothetical protein